LNVREVWVLEGLFLQGLFEAVDFGFDLKLGILGGGEEGQRSEQRKSEQ
jgi:hypothetical protein